MEGFKIYNPDSIKNFIARRTGETKFGEKVEFVGSFEELKNRKPKYVLLGIPEDIGVRVNLGKPGAATAWNACLKSLLNIQVNRFTNAEKVILLGEVDCALAMEKAGNIDVSDPNYIAKLGDLVAQLDEIVSQVVFQIVKAGKIPIIIGGGHNNAYGNIKGSSQAIKMPVNVLNIDAHTDLRTTDFRHSGNGFSFARKDKFLGDYRIFGLHKNYTPEYIFEEMNMLHGEHFYLFEHLLSKNEAGINEIFEEQLSLISEMKFGLELDCDAIQNFPSSAITPSGFSINNIRNFLEIAGKNKNILYLHICEAAPERSSEFETGKALSYFITDFIQ